MAAVANISMLQRLVDGWSAWRDRVLSSERFQTWAMRMPLARNIGKRRAAQLFDLCAGFTYTQVLTACVRTGLFPFLQQRPRLLAEIASHASLPEDAARTLLNGAIALRLVEDRGAGRYGLGVLGAAVLGNPGVRAMVEHNTLLYEDIRDPLSLLRGTLEQTKLQRYWAYASADTPDALPPGDVAPYSELMAVSQPLVAGQVLQHFDFGPYRALMDVGGGEGAFLKEIGGAVSHLELRLFDLPAVAERASTRLATAFGPRAQCHGGSFLHDALPAGADLISLVRVVHDHDDDAVLALFERVRAALPDDGTLLIAEPMSLPGPAARMCDAYLALYLRAMGQGRARSPDEIIDLLKRAGFQHAAHVQTRVPMVASLVVASPQVPAMRKNVKNN